MAKYRRLRAQVAVVFAVVMGLTLLPGVAGAGRPTTFSVTGANASCETGDAFISFGVNEVQGEGIFADLNIDVFDVGFFFGFTEDPEWDGTTLNATFELVGETPEGEVPGGEAVISATWQPTGEPEQFEDRFRDGNRWIEISESFTPAAVSGTLTAMGMEIDLAGCFGSLSEFTERATNPNAFVGRFSGGFLGCALEGPDGFVGDVFADRGDHQSFVSVFLFLGEDQFLSGFAEDGVSFTDSELTATVDLFDDFGEPAGVAAVDASLTSLGAISNDIIGQEFRVKSTFERFGVAGTVAVDGMVLDMVECQAETFSDNVRFTPSNGPKPGGKAPANDTPDGAVALATRQVTNTQTKGAADAPEAECVVTLVFEEEGEVFEEIFPIPLGKTVWYSFVGDGTTMTVDTAGSNFDTVVGIYTSGLEQLACNDDVGDEQGNFTLQAAATIDTNAGETYWVQVGGFGFFPEFDETAQFGRVRVRVR